MKPGKASKLSASKAPAFPQPKRLSIHGESRLLSFKAVAPEFCTEAHVLQKRNTKLSSVSPHLKDLWAESLSLTAIQGEERREIMQYLSFNSGNEPMSLKMGVAGGGAHQNRMRNFFNIYSPFAEILTSRQS